MSESSCSTNAQYIAGHLRKAIENLEVAMKYAMPYPQRYVNIKRLRDEVAEERAPKAQE